MRNTKWISEIWDTFNPEIIRHSFETTGITTSDLTSYNPLLKSVLNDEQLPNQMLVDNDLTGDLKAFDTESDSEGI